MAQSYQLSRAQPALLQGLLSPFFLLIMVLSSLKGVAPAHIVTALSPFEGLQIAVPFNVKISPASNSSLSISADQQVLNAVNSSVSNKVLYIGTDQNFKTQQPISATIFLPAGSLQQISILSSTNLVAVDDGFSVQALSARVVGTSTLYFKNLVAQQLSVTSTGYGLPFDFSELQCKQAIDQLYGGVLKCPAC
jgi:hypothetical protein